MQAIKDWLRANPEQGKALMRREFVLCFLQGTDRSGPARRAGGRGDAARTVAADPNFVPLGAPVFLKMERHEADGLWVAQDTGGAIKGPNRFDTFWGAGPDAVALAGGMSSSGQALILLPKGVAAACARSALTRRRCGRA